MCNTVSNSYDDLLKIYFDKYNDLWDVRCEMDPKYDHTNLILDEYDSGEWYKEKPDDLTVKSDEEELGDLPSLEGDEEKVKEGKWLKILTPNKLLTRLTVLLAQIKAQNNSYKLKRKILYQQNKIKKKSCNNLIKSLLQWECILMTTRL